jgi:hypothetical protein
MESLLLDPWRRVDASRLVERHRADAVGDRYLAFFDAAVQARRG